MLPDIAHPESDEAERKFLHFSDWQKMTFHKRYLQLADIREVLQHPHRNSWAKDIDRVEFAVREKREEEIKLRDSSWNLDESRGESSSEPKSRMFSSMKSE